MKEFNLNSEILVHITDYGWNHITKNETQDYINHCILTKEWMVNGKKYYRLQAHTVISLFGNCVWATFPCPIEPIILIP